MKLTLTPPPALFLALLLPLTAVADEESRLFDELLKAQRQYEKASAVAVQKGKNFSAYCTSIDKQLGIKPSGFAGCIDKPKPAETPKPEPAKSETPKSEAVNPPKQE